MYKTESTKHIYEQQHASTSKLDTIFISTVYRIPINVFFEIFQFYDFYENENSIIKSVALLSYMIRDNKIRKSYFRMLGT